jgi:hypothetical protein
VQITAANITTITNDGAKIDLQLKALAAQVPTSQIEITSQHIMFNTPYLKYPFHILADEHYLTQCITVTANYAVYLSWDFSTAADPDTKLTQLRLEMGDNELTCKLFTAREFGMLNDDRLTISKNRVSLFAGSGGGINRQLSLDPLPSTISAVTLDVPCLAARL